MVGVRTVHVVRDFRVRLEFTDGTAGEVDLDPYMSGPIFDQLRHDRRLFESVSVDPEWQTIAWPNGADMDTDVLYDLADPSPPSP